VPDFGVITENFNLTLLTQKKV